MGYLGIVFCGLLGWMAIDYGSPTGLLLSLIAGIPIFPPLWNRLATIGKSLHWSVRWTSTVLLALTAMAFNSATPEAMRVAAKHDAKRAAKEQAEQNKAVAGWAKKEQAAEEEKKSGEHCLSGWDGSFPDLKNAIKMSLRNPRSFEHVSTNRSPVDDKGTFGLIMTYRAENGFGGMNVEAVGVEVKAQDCAFKRVSERSLAARLKSG